MSAGQRLPGTPQPMHVWPGAAGVRIAADSWGDRTGALVLLLHGGGQTRHSWRNSGEILGRAGYHAVAFDARGHGDSDWAPDGNYGQDIMVQDLQCVVSALGRRRPVLVGASMGGGTALVAVGEQRVDATALIMVDIAPRIEAEGVAKIGEFMGQAPHGFDSLEDVALAIANYQPHRRRPRNLDGLAKNVRLAPNGKYRWHWDPRCFPDQRDLEKRHERLRACAMNVNVPTLLVRGGMSDVLSEEGVRDFLALCPHAEYVAVNDAAHMVAGDRNDVFGTAVIEFLSRNVPVRGEPICAPRELTPRHQGPDGDLVDVP